MSDKTDPKAQQGKKEFNPPIQQNPYKIRERIKEKARPSIGAVIAIRGIKTRRRQ